MLSTLKLNSLTYIGRDEEKKLTLIITFLMDSPEAAEFINPVDWEELELNDYPMVVKHPMNLLKVQDKIKNREYRTIEEALDHMQLVWDNCKAYNPEGQYFILADKMERNFKKMIRNYLPNIQVTIPKPVGSTGHPIPEKPMPLPVHHPHPHPQRTAKPLPKVPLVPSYSMQSNREHFSELGSANQHLDIGESEEIPLSEKNRLHQRLKQLSQQQLAQVVFMIQDSCGEGFKEMGGGRAQLLLDSIDGETFKRVNLKIDDLLEGEKVAGSKKVKA